MVSESPPVTGAIPKGTRQASSRAVNSGKKRRRSASPFASHRAKASIEGFEEVTHAPENNSDNHRPRRRQPQATVLAESRSRNPGGRPTTRGRDTVLRNDYESWDQNRARDQTKLRGLMQSKNGKCLVRRQLIDFCKAYDEKASVQLEGEADVAKSASPPVSAEADLEPPCGQELPEPESVPAAEQSVALTDVGIDIHPDVPSFTPVNVSSSSTRARRITV